MDEQAVDEWVGGATNTVIDKLIIIPCVTGTCVQHTFIKKTDCVFSHLDPKWKSYF